MHRLLALDALVARSPAEQSPDVLAAVMTRRGRAEASSSKVMTGGRHNVVGAGDGVRRGVAEGGDGATHLVAEMRRARRHEHARVVLGVEAHDEIVEGARPHAHGGADADLHHGGDGVRVRVLHALQLRARVSIEDGERAVATANPQMLTDGQELEHLRRQLNDGQAIAARRPTDARAVRRRGPHELIAGDNVVNEFCVSAPAKESRGVRLVSHH